MSTTHLLEQLPDLVVLLRRDGIILSCYGGKSVAWLRPSADAAGKHLEDVWTEPMSGLIRQLIRDAVVRREIVRAVFRDAGHRYGLRLSVQGTDRAVCVIRTLHDATHSAGQEAVEGSRHLQRRGLLRRYNETISVAALRATPAAVAVIQVDGVTDLAQIICPSISERIMGEALRRIEPLCGNVGRSGLLGHFGPIGDSVLLVSLASADRGEIAACLAGICDNLRQPVRAGDATFHLTPYAGVAILGQDGSSPKILLDHASAAASEARRTGSSRPCFFTDSARTQAAARLDIARELRSAIADGHIGLNYIGRHELSSGRLVAWVGHLCWQHPVHGEIHPLELVRLAEITGLAPDLSRAALKALQKDYFALASRGNEGVRISFGPPRHHVLHESFVSDIEHFLAQGTIPPDRLELRISVKAAMSRNSADLKSLAQRGIQLIVDDMGRGMDLPLAWLARAPVQGLQLNRSWVQAIQNDAVALRMCRAGVGVATALGLVPVAMSVDLPVQRDVLLDAGCLQGAGELYHDYLPQARLNIIEHRTTPVAA